VVSEVIVQLGGVLEWDRVPEPAPSAGSEELLPEDVCDRLIREPIVRLRWPLAADGPDHTTARGAGAYPRRDARIRTRVDEHSSIDEDPVGLLEGIDHALVRNSSERPREDHHVERRVPQSQRLRGSLAEFHVGNALAFRLGASARKRSAIGVHGKNGRRVASRTECEPAFAGTDIGDAEAAEVDAVCAELDLGRRPEEPETAGEDPT
jgi:hypothetical protein